VLYWVLYSPHKHPTPKTRINYIFNNVSYPKFSLTIVYLTVSCLV